MRGEKRILQLLLDAVAGGVFPGAVLLVACNKKTLFCEAVGNGAILPAPRLMTSQTRFDLASLTKPLATALTTVSLVSQKKLQLDDALAELLPVTNIPQDKQEITLRQLLCHCSGLPAWKPYYLSLQTLPLKERKGRLREMILQEPLDSSPGTTTTYSDLGFLVIEWILEQISGKNLHHFTQHNLFGHLSCATPVFLPLDQDQGSGQDLYEFADTE